MYTGAVKTRGVNVLRDTHFNRSVGCVDVIRRASTMRSNQANRRVFLKAAGMSLALPWLESGAALSAARTEQAVGQPPIRFVTTFFPLGVNTHKWGACGSGEDLTLEPTLEPLEVIKHKVSVLQGLSHPHLKDVRGHAGKVASFLTGEPGGRDNNKSGVSIDQRIAARIADQTEFRSLVLGVAPSRNGRGFYDSSISWRGPDRPLAKEIDPAMTFATLFADKSWLKRDESVLDFVLDQAKHLETRISAQDSQTLAEYFEGIRELELRIARLDRDTTDWQRQQAGELSISRRFHADDPSGAGETPDFALYQPENFREHTRLMLDLLVLALRMDKTRVLTFMFDSYGPKYMDFSFLPGVTGQWHSLSHHKETPSSLHQYHLINQWHVSQFTYLLQKMDEAQEGDRTLLDNSMVMIGSDMWDGNRHTCTEYPLLLAGSGGGRIKTGRAIDFEDGSMSRLFLSIAETMGTPLDGFQEACESLGSQLAA